MRKRNEKRIKQLQDTWMLLETVGEIKVSEIVQVLELKKNDVLEVVNALRLMRICKIETIPGSELKGATDWIVRIQIH